MCKCFHIKVRHPLLLQRLLKKIAISVARRWQNSPGEKSLLIKKKRFYIKTFLNINILDSSYYYSLSFFATEWMAEKYIIQISLYPKVLNRFFSLFSPPFSFLQCDISFQLKLLPSFFCGPFHERNIWRTELKNWTRFSSTVKPASLKTNCTVG